MSFDTINKTNLDNILKDLAKEYRKLGGKTMPAEIILIGGAAVIENYGFRDMTTDIDALISAYSTMKDAINVVGDRLNLPAGWLNDDFKKTSSYSPVLSEISQHYKTFSNVLKVRTVTAEYLVAMKLKAGRAYKNDISDIVGILAEHKANGKPLNYNDIDKAVIKLYGNWEGITEENKTFLESLFKNENYVQIYQEVRENELSNKDILIDFEKKYENVTNMDNVDSILKTLKEKQKNNK